MCFANYNFREIINLYNACHINSQNLKKLNFSVFFLILYLSLIFICWGIFNKIFFSFSRLLSDGYFLFIVKICIWKSFTCYPIKVCENQNVNCNWRNVKEIFLTKSSNMHIKIIIVLAQNISLNTHFKFNRLIYLSEIYNFNHTRIKLN